MKTVKNLFRKNHSVPQLSTKNEVPPLAKTDRDQNLCSFCDCTTSHNDSIMELLRLQEKLLTIHSVISKAIVLGQPNTKARRNNIKNLRRSCKETQLIVDQCKKNNFPCQYLMSLKNTIHIQAMSAHTSINNILIVHLDANPFMQNETNSHTQAKDKSAADAVSDQIGASPTSQLIPCSSTERFE